MPEVELNEKETKSRRRICLALDNIDSPAQAIALARELNHYIGMMKVGSELHTRAGNSGIPIVQLIHRKGTDVFLDLKYHDTPNTVYQDGKAVAANHGVYMFNIHISGGEEMCRKAKEGALEESIKQGRNPPLVIGVTELTSLSDEDLAVQGIDIKYNDLVRRRTELAIKWGLDGVVCPASKAGALEKEFGPHLLYVTPGIAWGGKSGPGQKQLYTPDLAVKDCKNSILVIGSAITAAEDKKKTAYEILRAVSENID